MQTTNSSFVARFRDKFWKNANIVATDFFLSNNLVIFRLLVESHISSLKSTPILNAIMFKLKFSYQ